MCKILNLKMSLLFVVVFCLFQTTMAQQKTIQSTIVDANNDPVIGATILEKGTSNGTISDLDGHFSLQINEEGMIQISYVGFITIELSAGMIPPQIVMHEDAATLGEVIVTGYTTQRKADLTGAVSVVDIDDMMSVPENNPMKALQGRVAGMNISADGNPSGAATIRIRGIGTLNNNDPLYIIDGMPSKAGMHELNSNDIESIQVLKDASAATIYGSRAANGVIIITTKQGKQGKIRVNFDSYLTASFYKNRLETLNAKEYGQALWQANINGGNDPNSNNIGYRFDWEYDSQGTAMLQNMYLPKFIDDKNTMHSSDTDWFDEVSRTGIIQSYNLSVSNGTEKGNYYFSLGYFENEGTIKYSNFNRISTRINSDYKLLDGMLTLGENFTINHTSELQAPGGVLDSALKALPMVPVHTIDGVGWGGPSKGMNDRQNPVRLITDNKDNPYRYWRTFGNAFIDLEPVKSFHLRSSFGIDYGNFYKRFLQKTYTSGFLTNNISAVNLEQSHWMKWNWSNTLTYKKTIDKHDFDLLGGTEMYRQSDISFNAFTSGENAFVLETPEYMWPDVSTGKAQVGGGETGYSLLSYFGKANYVYDNRYLASVTVRHDGSSRFGKNNRWGTFPAFSLGWRLSEETFMETTKNVISDLKLRLGWGQTGNQEIDNYSIYTIYVPDYGVADPTWDIINGTAYDISGSGSGTLPAGFRKIQSGNDDLKWETTTQTNLGLDFAFFNNSFYGSAEYYIKETKDILIKPAFLGVVGEGGSRWANGASMENRGIEFLLGYRNNTGYGLKYDITANISGFKNKVTHLPEEVENSYGGRAGDNILGHPYGSYYGYVADGIFKNQEEVDNHVPQAGKAIGRIRYKNVYNEDGKDEINTMDQTWIGKPYPDFSYGLTINLEYKSFDLSMFFQGIQGIDIINGVKYQADFWSVDDINSNKGRRLLNAFHPITNPNSNIPMLQNTNTNDEGRFSTYFVEDGSYMKLRNAQLGYTLQSDLAHQIKLEKLRFYVSAQNLFTLHSKKYTGVDPENPGFGYPIATTCTFGLNLTF